MLQPALTPARCSIRRHQMSCTEISDSRFRSHLNYVSMIFAFLGLSACFSTPSTAIQPLLHRVTAQRELWPRGSLPTPPEHGLPSCSRWGLDTAGIPYHSAHIKARLSQPGVSLDLCPVLMALYRHSSCEYRE